MESNSVCNHSSARESDVFNHEYDRTGRHKVLLTPPGYVLSFFPRHFLSYDKTKKTLIEGNGTKKTKMLTTRSQPGEKTFFLYRMGK